MPSRSINSGDTIELIEKRDGKPYRIRVTGESVNISRTGDRRFANNGLTYPVGYVGPIHNDEETAVYAHNPGTGTATIEIDASLSDTGSFDPAASGTQTVTDDGNFNLAGNQDVDIAEQSLARLTTDIELTNGTSYGLVHRNGNDLQVSIEQDNAASTTKDVQVVDVNFDTSQTDALDVSAATVPTEQQTPVALEDEAGTAISGTNPLSVDASAGGTVATDPTNDITRSLGTVRLEQPASVIAFQHTTSGTTAESLPANSVSPRGTITVQADPDNTGNVFLGNGTNQVIQLSPGDSIGEINVDDTSDLSVQTPTSGDAVNVVAS